MKVGPTIFQPTSLSDYDAFRAFCERAARDDGAFRNFRRHPECVRVIETLKRRDGADYLRSALQQTPGFSGLLDRFATSDLVGRPRTSLFRTGMLRHRRFAPTTLRYIRTASDLQIHFGSLDGLRILEIGGGYGGLCKIITDVWPVRAYTIIDLPEPLGLAQRFLTACGAANVEFVDGTAGDLMPPSEPYDLVISNYAFSELGRASQSVYLRTLMHQARRGYLMWNFLWNDLSSATMSLDEFTASVDRARVIDDPKYLSRLDHYCGVKLVIWGAP
jgi:putative sugar O-methyltransferase